MRGIESSWLCVLCLLGAVCVFVVIVSGCTQPRHTEYEAGERVLEPAVWPDVEPTVDEPPMLWHVAEETGVRLVAEDANFIIALTNQSSELSDVQVDVWITTQKEDDPVMMVYAIGHLERRDFHHEEVCLMHLPDGAYVLHVRVGHDGSLGEYTFPFERRGDEPVVIDAAFYASFERGHFAPGGEPRVEFRLSNEYIKPF